MRFPRVKAEGQSFYHCVSRVVDRRFIFQTTDHGSAEAERFLLLMRRLEAFTGVRVLTYALMSNHFHLLCEVPQAREVSEAELLDRIQAGYGPGRRQALDQELARLRQEPDDADRIPSLFWLPDWSNMDVVNMKWPNVDLENGILEFRVRKTGKKAVLALHSDIIDCLANQPRSDDPKAFLFRSLAGRRGSGGFALSSEFKKIVTKAKIVGRQVESERRGTKMSTLSFHALRQTYVSDQHLRQRGSWIDR
jgi:hypothetical protein